MSQQHASVHGVFAAVCVDVIHARVFHDQTWRPLVTLVFAVDAPGRPHTLASQQYPMDLTPGSRLRNALEAWRGVPFTEAHLDAFDIDHCVGVGATVRVQSNRSKSGRLSVSVQRITPLPKDDTPSMPPAYIRYHHRQAVVA